MESRSSLKEKSSTLSKLDDQLKKDLQTTSGITEENSENEESVGSNLESETRHMSICDRSVNHEDISDMADKINSSPSEKFSIEFCDCNLTIDHLKYFCEKIKDANCQIATLALTYLKNIDNLLEKTCFIVWKYRTTNLSLECDAISDKSIGIIIDYLEDKSIETLRLDISYNTDISAAGFKNLGRILNKLKIVSLEVTDCDITDEKLQAFLSTLQDVKLRGLNISHNRNLTNEGFKALAEFVANKGIDSLRMSGCNISNEVLNVFNEYLLHTGQKLLIKELDVSYNSTMEPNTSLGSVVYKCGVSSLSMAGCKLSKDHLVSFRESVKNHEMNSLNIGDNVSIGPYLEELSTLVIQCQIKDLNISDCMFSAQELESFRTSLNGAKMNCLHLGDPELDPDKKYVDQLRALLENVEDVLYLQFHKLGDEFRASLQQNCRNPVHIELTVDGKKEKISENKSSAVKVGEQSVDQESSTFIQIEKPGSSTFMRIEEPRPASESEEYFGSNLESETEHIWIRDRAVNREDIIAMADKINSSSSEKFSIEFCDCDLTIDHLKYFCEKIKDAHFQITTLAVRYMRNIDDLLEKTCFIVWKYRTANLSLECDAMNDKSIGILRDYLKEKPIETLRLDISYNSDISAAGFANLGRIMNKLKFVSLEATDCDITDEKLQAFLNALQDVKLQGLNIGHNRNLTNEGFKALAEFVTNKGIESLQLSGCNISKEILDVFDEHLLQTEQKILLKDLDVSYNSTMEPNTSLGSVVYKCGVSSLSMAGCKLSKDHLISFRESVKNHEMNSLNIGDNVSIGPNLEELATLVIQCQVKELNISDCMFSARELESFRTSLNGTKMSCLHLGDEELEPDKKYVDELCALLENVEHGLYLQFHKLGNEFRTSLQKNCRNPAHIELTVDGKKEIISENKSSPVEVGEQSVDQESSTFIQIEKPGPSTFMQIEEPRPASESEEYFGSNLESETEHIWIRDHAVNHEDIIAMADKINSLSSEKFSIEFCDCDLTTDHLECFCEKIKDAHCQITTLALTYMKNIDDLLEKTCFIVWKYRTTNLSLECDAINDKSIGIIRDYLKDKSIETRSLDISYNSDISASGFENLGRILSRLKTVSLEATDCDITDEKLQAFLNTLQDVKLQRLNIGHNRNLTNEGFKEVAEFVANKGIDSLQLSGCNISKEILDVFDEHLVQTGQMLLIKELDVSYNSTMGPNTSLGSMVSKCGVTNLNMAGCKLSEDHLVRFKESVKYHEMNLLNIGDNVSIGPYLQELAALVIQCQVKELNISDCILSAQELKNFRTSLHGTKVNRIHLGDSELEPDKKYVDELCALLENVEAVLYLQFHKLSNDFRSSLRNNCRNFAQIELTVGGKKEKICGNKCSSVEAEQSIDQGLSTSTQVEKPRPASGSEDSEDDEELEQQALPIGSTEDMLQPYQAILDNMSNSTEDIEVVFKNEIIKIFSEAEEFIKFAQSRKGLNLDKSSIQSIINKRSIKINESQKMAVLQLWREKNELMATPNNIRKIVKRFFNIKEDEIIHLGNGRARYFRNHDLYSSQNAYLGEVSTTTGYRFCAIQIYSDYQDIQEVTKLIDKKHENVVTVIDAGTYSDDLIYIATEFTWTTSLQDILRKNPFDEPTALNLAKQMLIALDFIHSHDIIFGNVNFEGIMVSEDGKQLKLTYYQKVRYIELPDTFRQWNKLPVPEKDKCKESDIFSAGIVLAEIFSQGINPYGDKSYEIEYNIRDSINLDLNNLQLRNRREAKEVITYMLDPEPENRSTAVQVLSDITFLQYHFKAPEDEQDPIFIRGKKSTTHKQEITQWTLDKKGNLTMLGEPHIKNTVAEHPVKSVIIYDRKVTESDIPTTSVEESEECVFEFWGCEITIDFLQLFYEKMNSKHRITKFKIAYMKPGKVSDLIEMICCIVIKWEIESLSLEHNYLKDDDIDLLQKCFRNSEKFYLIELDISYNKDITSAGFRKLGEIKREINIYSLLVTACDVTDDKLEKFIEGLRDGTIRDHFWTNAYFKQLDLSCNPNLTARGYKSLAKHLKKCGVRHFKLRACKLTEEIIDEFFYHLRGTQMMTLDLSYNPGVTINDFLLSIISETGIRKMNLSGCEFRYKQSVHVTEFHLQPQSPMVLTLCLRDNSTISGGLDGITKLVKDFKLTELDIADCMLSASDLRDFREGLKETKLKRLHLGDLVRELDVPYMEEVVNLLPNVTELLYLELHKFNSDFLQILKKQTAKCPTVLMKFSDGSTQEWIKYGKYRALKLLTNVIESESG